MVRATTDEIGRALYHLLKNGGSSSEITQLEEPPLIIESRTHTRRITRRMPDGSIEIIEETITDERAY